MGSLLLALLPVVFAGSLAVLPPGAGPEREEVLRAALDTLGYPDATLLPAEEFAATVKLVRVDGLPSGDECDAPVPLDAWRGRFDEARRNLQLLAFTDALAAFVALDVELVCLATPPATSDLFRLELAAAEAHTFLARAAGRDAGQRRFHEDEARGALTRAAAFGASLSVPPDVASEVLTAYERIRRRTPEDPPRVVVAGPGARVGARFNGRPIPPGPFDGVVGANLVQAAEGATVTAAARLRLTDGRTLVWLSPDRVDPNALDLTAALAARVRTRPDAASPGDALLAAAVRLLGDAGEVVFVGDAGGAAWVWAAGGGGDQALSASAPVIVPRPAVDAWRAVVGAGPSAGWSDLGSGPLDGLGGGHAGLSLHGRVAVNPWLAVAVGVDPWAVAAPIPDDQGGGTLFRATVPARAGVRFGPHTRRFAFEGGVDVGLHAFGAFPEDRGRAARVSFLALGAVGVSGALGPHLAARAHAWFGAGLGYATGGGALGLEGRL